MTATELQQVKDAIWDVRYPRAGDGHDRNLDTVLIRLDNIANALKRLGIALAVPMDGLDLDPPGGPTTPANYDPDAGP